MSNDQFKLVLEGERPWSWQGNYNGTKHWSLRAAEAHRVHTLVQDALAKLKSVPRFTEKVIIEMTCFMKSPVFDYDNVCDKFYIDGLKRYDTYKIGRKFFKDERKHWLFDDDSPTYVPGGGVFVIKDNDNPRVEIYIKPYEEKD